MHCSCGNKFNPDKAAEAFNSHFDDEYDYYLNGWENWCSGCAISGMEHDIEEGLGDSDVGCAACGNPHYPDCKSSCRMFY